ncbi:MAG: TolC family protein [Sandaracinaceae bacterium]|nr:TolC family protein [Sandaracinaceae bacterium]MBP7682134.1 TolC family protein [Deltaproteobacteria bacterium]MBK6812908.1 TolC family protein [Sandaracinaceae bacterium]MBK7773732.1 TolC family protein [Sandaracinaceae bacterium]MBK8412759.1 TolC family protein [Sandaracinaceae bacterium]
MTRFSFVLTLLACSLHTGAPAIAQEATDFSDLSLLMGPVQEGLTADQVAVLAVTNAPQAEAAAAAQARAEAAYREVRVGLFPQLALQANYTRLSEVDLPPFDIGGTIIDNPFPQILNTYLLRASLSIPVTEIFLTTLPAMRAAERGQEAARFQTETQNRQLAIQGREAFYQLIQARARVIVAQDSVRLLESLLATTEAMVERGVVAAVELSEVRARLSSVRVVLLVAEGDAAIAEVALVQRIGGAPGDRVVIGESVFEEAAALPPALDGGRVTLALDARPEAQALRLLVEVRRAEARTTLGAQVPQLAVVGAIDYANPNQRIFPQTAEFRATWSVGVNLTWSPNAFAAARHRAAGINATVAEAEAQLRSLERAVTIEVYQADAALRAAAASMQSAQDAVDAAREAYESRVLRFEAGAATSNEVLDSETAVRRAQVDLVDAHLGYRLARARLDYALGLTPETR